MRKLQCVELTVLQELHNGQLKRLYHEVAGLLWAAQTRFDSRRRTPLASGLSFPCILLLKGLESHDFLHCCHMQLETVAKLCGSSSPIKLRQA